nr:MAG TPA: hypothetical protein [Crassvirales sp.]
MLVVNCLIQLELCSNSLRVEDIIVLILSPYYYIIIGCCSCYY